MTTILIEYKDSNKEYLIWDNLLPRIKKIVNCTIYIEFRYFDGDIDIYKQIYINNWDEFVSQITDILID
jgi:hypothetical protein